MKKPELKKITRIRTHYVISSADYLLDKNKGSASYISFGLHRKGKQIQKYSGLLNKIDYREH